jgi:ABC-type uncharacterized transport system YnjBCD permease subunit
MVQRERVFRYERGPTNAPLWVNDCQFAIGFESANLKESRRPQRPWPALRLLVTHHLPLTTVLSVTRHWPFPLALPSE